MECDKETGLAGQCGARVGVGTVEKAITESLCPGEGAVWHERYRLEGSCLLPSSPCPLIV